MLHLCVDARMIDNSGIGVYIQNYITFLKSVPSVNITLLGDSDKLFFRYGNSSNIKIVAVKSRIYSIGEQFWLPIKIPKCDIFWSPHYNIPILPIRARKRLVTLPDVAHIALANTFQFGLIKRVYSRFVLNLSVILSDRIITISKFSKEELVKFTGVKPNKVSVIYLGIDKGVFNIPSKTDLIDFFRNNIELPRKYILFVGNVKPHKNLSALILAFSKIKTQLEDYKILIVGKKEGFITGDNEVVRLISEQNLVERIQFTGYVDENSLKFLYSGAAIFIFPSIYEGFGFPPIEAMACGCVVASSNAASMPEICGDAVEYFDPKNVKELSSLLLKMLNEDHSKSEIIKKGKRRSELFDWSESSKLFLEMLNTLK
ncbi:MAG: glycosyltransferase family 4 protein [Cytophagales bacterium]|nr:glycosyltransferase family 4 protein [Cytophagales bacterium]